MPPKQIVNEVAAGMWALGYAEAPFGERDRGIFSMTEDSDDVELGGTAAGKYLRIAVSRLIALLHTMGAAGLLPVLPPVVTRLVSETDLSLSGWMPADLEADAWWLPTESSFWAAAEPRIWDGDEGWPHGEMPDPAGLLMVDEPETKLRRAVLFGTRQWNLEDPGAEIGWGRRIVTLTIRGYLARRSDREAVNALLATGDWIDALPGEHEWTALWAGEYPWRRMSGLRHEPDQPGTALLRPVVELRTSAGPWGRYDDRVVPLPAAAFLEPRRPLAWHADGTYRPADRSVALCHPDATTRGPTALLADWGYLRDFLHRKSLDLMWVVQMQDNAEPYGQPFDSDLRTMMSWAFRLERGSAVLVSTHALSAAGAP
jgi:hypothetical protein